jgi:hypothetical protein
MHFFLYLLKVYDLFAYIEQAVFVQDWISITYLLFYILVGLIVWSLYREIATSPVDYINRQVPLPLQYRYLKEHSYQKVCEIIALNNSLGLK